MKDKNQKPFLIRDVSMDVTDRSGMPLRSDKEDTLNGTKSMEMKNLLEDKVLNNEKRIEIHKKTDRDFLIESIKCALPKDKRLNFEYQMETRTNIGIPRRFFDLLIISDDSKTKYIILRKSLKNIDMMLSILALMTIIIAAIDNTSAITFYNILVNEFFLRPENKAMRILIIIFSFISIILIIKRYSCILNIHKVRIGTVARKDTIFSKGLWWVLIIEILFHLVVIPPSIEHHFNINGSIYVEYDYSKLFNIDGLYLSLGKSLPPAKTISTVLRSSETSIQLYYNTSAILTFFILFRIYHLFRLNLTISYWATPKANSICKIMNTKADFSFNIRATLRHRPFFSLSFAIVFIITAFGIATQLFEFYNSEMIYALDEKDNQHARTMQKFSNIYNSFWLIVVTMTTLGYGDIYPTTYFGRVIAILACIFGTFILSSLIVFLGNFISFDELERYVYNSIIKGKSKSKMLQKEASGLVGKLIRYNYLRKRQNETSAKYRLNLWIDMQYKTKTFKMLRVSGRKAQVDLGGLMENIEDQLKIGVDPFKEALNVYNKNRNMNDKTSFVLDETTDISSKFMKNTVQMWNLLKILNKDRFLPNLNDIGEVYDQTANVIEEIIYYHNYKETLNPELKKELGENRNYNYYSSSSSTISNNDDENANLND